MSPRAANGGIDSDGYSDNHIGENDHRKRLPWQQWIERHMNWSWFTCTQSTGGIAIVLSECPKQFHGLQTIGTIVFIFNLVLWLTFVSLMVIRWTSNPATFKSCFTDAPECFFFGSFWLSIATMIICIQRFGQPNVGDWLVVVNRVLFWIYAAVTLLSTTIHFVIIFKYTSIKAIEMNPAWLLLIFNTMLTGTIAAAIAETQPPRERMPILVAGVGYQGLGWIVSVLFLTWFIGNLLEKGWPDPSHRPGLFMTVGTGSYTTIALVGAARAAPEGYGYFAAHPMAKEILEIVATWVGVFLWIFSLWLFGLALCVNVAEAVMYKNGRWIMPMTYTNTWWGFIFSNVGFALSTVYLGQQLESNAVLWVSVAMIILLVIFWLLDLCLMARTIAVSIFFDSRVSL